MTIYRIAYILLTIGVSPPLAVLIQQQQVPQVAAIVLPPLITALVAILAELGAAATAKVVALTSQATGEPPQVAP